MDLDGARTISLLSAKTAGNRLPGVIGLTRRGDLKSKLAAFEAGVDDILTVPFAPEELLARVMVQLRRFYSDAVTFTPVIKIGELQIDILKRTAPPRIKSQIREHIAWLNRCLTDLDQELGQLIRSSPVWRERVDLLRSTPGVGPVLSATLLADVPELGSLGN